jgi:hypothetical protein
MGGGSKWEKEKKRKKGYEKKGKAKITAKGTHMEPEVTMTV